jgi:crotonobetainyl-CoA:carnitine CoA-transferase CaiB-like acyl-CoA transferase
VPAERSRKSKGATVGVEGLSIFEGLNVIEVSGHGGAAMAAKQLADWGARVTVLEPPDGTPLREAPPYYEADGRRRGATWEWLSRGKMTVRIAPSAAREACARADVVLVESEMTMPALGLKPDEVRRQFAGATTCVLIAPFATDGPYAEYAATDLGIAALGGWMSVLGEPSREPLRPGGEMVSRISGLFALVAALTGLRYVRQGGAPQYVEVSQQAAAASMLIAPWLVKSMLGFPYERRGNPWPMGPMDCADGYVGIPPLTPTHWEMMCQLMGIGDILADPQAHDYGWRTAHAEELKARVRPWLMERTRAEVFAEAQAYRLPAAPFQTAADRVECPQLEARGFWKQAEIGGKMLKVPRVSYSIGGLAPVERGPLREAGTFDGGASKATTGSRATAGSPHHDGARPDDSNGASPGDPRLPFDGIRILDLTWFWSGPYAMMMLAALGADVVKIESATRPDPYRYIWALTARESWWEWSPLWVDTNAGKRSLALDLSSAEGKELFERMVTNADIVISNYANRVMPNLGLTNEYLHSINPRLIAVTMPGYGPGGPWEDYVGYGVAFEQLVCATMTGYEDEAPQMMGGFCDPIVGLHTVAAISLALQQREATGCGTAVEVPQCETLDSVFAPEHIAVQHGAPAAVGHGNKHAWMAPHNAYRTAGNDEWITIAVGSDGEFAALANALSVPALASDKRFATVAGRKENEAALDSEVAAALKDRLGAELERELQGAGVKACRVVKSYLLPEDENLLQTGFWQELTRDITGTHWQKKWPFRFAGIDASHRRPAPVMGEHTAEVLREFLGLSNEEVDRLEAAGVVGGSIKAFA